MFRITRDPSSGSFIQCLAKNYNNGSIASVDMDVVGVMTAHFPVVRVCTVQSRDFAGIVSTNYIFVHLLDNVF